MSGVHEVWRGSALDGWVVAGDGGGMGVEFGVLVDVRGDRYGEVRAEVVAAEGLGFSSAWLSEHHLARDGVLPSPLVMAGALLGRTERIRVGTNVLVLPFRHPVLV